MATILEKLKLKPKSLHSRIMLVVRGAYNKPHADSRCNCIGNACPK